MRDLPNGLFITLPQYPNELAQRRDRNCDEICFLKSLRSEPRLMPIVPQGIAQQEICIRRDLHRRPAHAFAVILLICSIVSLGVPFLAKDPLKAAIVPFFSAAPTSSRPSGSFSASIFCPGATFRCLSSSCFRVIWPFAVIVSVVINPPDSIVRQISITVQRF